MAAVQWRELEEIVTLAIHHGWATDVTIVLLTRNAVQLVAVMRTSKDDLPKLARAIWKRRRR